MIFFGVTGRFAAFDLTISAIVPIKSARTVEPTIR